MSASDPEVERDLKLFELLHGHYMQDLREFWARSNFYLVAETGCLAVWASTSDRTARTAVPIAGILLGLFWLSVAQACVGWLSDWRAELRALDVIVDRHAMWDRLEGKKRAFWQRPSTLTALLPAFIMIAWVVLLCVQS